MSKEISRRDFLKMAGLTAAGVLFSSCSPKEPTPTAQPEAKDKEPTAVPTLKPTETKLPPTPTAVPTKVPTPTEAPKPTPTEVLKEKWGKVWLMHQSGAGTGGPESGLTRDEERFGAFIEQITRQLEQKKESLKQTELFVGAFPKPLFDEKGKPKLRKTEEVKDWLICAFIFSKTGERKVYCATEQEKGKEAQVGAISTVFSPEPRIWGASCQEKVDGSITVSCADGTIYQTEKTVFGSDLTKLISGKETKTGYLFTAKAFQGTDSKPSSFFLTIKDEKKLPHLPDNKSKFNQEKYTVQFSLEQARYNLWEETKPNPSFIGFWDLEKGEWQGETNYQGKEGYGKLFKEEEMTAEKAPKIEGLKAVEENGKIVYRAEKGNPYGLKEGEMAGYVIPLETGETVQEGIMGEVKFNKGVGLVLEDRVILNLLSQANSPEAIKQGKWKMVLNFDPRDSHLRIWETSPNGITYSLSLSGISGKVEFVYPFPDRAIAWRAFRKDKDFEKVGFWLPKELVAEGGKVSLGFYFLAGDINVKLLDYSEREVEFRELLFTNVGTNVLSVPPFPQGSQFVIAAGSPEKARSISLKNIFSVDGAPVFMMAR